MMQKWWLVLLWLGAVCFSNVAVGKKCEGAMWTGSDSADVIEEYNKPIKVFLPIKVQLSSSLLDCADEIWIESLYSNSLRFYGPNINKTGKLIDHQFTAISAKKGVWKTAITGRETSLWIQLSHYSLFPAGNYYGKIRVSVVDGNKVVDEQDLDIVYYSAPKIAIDLDNASQSKVGGSNGNYQIDLGELSTGLRFNWGIKILSNSAYAVVLDSEFNGLRHETDHSLLLDYTLGFDNVKISSSDQLVRYYDFWSSVNNTWFGFSVELGNVDLKPAGHYQDNISLTIYPY